MEYCENCGDPVDENDDYREDFGCFLCEGCYEFWCDFVDEEDADAEDA